MLENSYKLFGLDQNATLHDIKKKYRQLARENHPDRFMDVSEKKRQEALMKAINEAYEELTRQIQSKIKDPKPENKSPGRKPSTDLDYQLYKKGVEFFNRCYAGILVKMERHDLKAKAENLNRAKSFFARLLEEYPDSDWSFDSEEKLKKINTMIRQIEESGESHDKAPLPREKPAFYQNKFQEMFRKK